MANNNDHRTNGLETDNTGGVLSGLLAEEDDLDRRALWRLGSWGVGAVGAVVLAVLANQTQSGWKRDQLAASDLNQRAQQIQNVANHTEREARRLASAIETLNSDRDRLYTRVTSLEQGLDSVTGSIARQHSANASPAPLQAAEPQAAPMVGPVTTQTAAATPEKSSAIPSEPSPATVSSVAKDPPKESARPDKKSEVAKAEAARVEAAKVETAKAEVAKAEVATPATPLVAAKSFMAPPDPSASRLIEPGKSPGPVTAGPIPEVVAALPTAADAEADEEAAPKIAVQRTQFGVDLGAANTVPGLRALWRGLLKSKSNAPLHALRPIIVIKEAGNGPGMQLRLVAGPLNDAGAAARICAVLTENKRNCETAIFDGQRLSLSGGEDPAPAPSAKPSSRRRGAAAKRAAAVEPEEPPKKPEPPSATATISSWFGKKGQ